MARRMPQASSSLKALTITRPRQGRTRHMLGRERPPLYAPCLDRSERSSPLLHPPSKQDLPASVPALVGADQHHLSGLGLPTTLPEGSLFGNRCRREAVLMFFTNFKGLPQRSTYQTSRLESNPISGHALLEIGVETNQHPIGIHEKHAFIH